MNQNFGDARSEPQVHDEQQADFRLELVPATRMRWQLAQV